MPNVFDPKAGKLLLPRPNRRQLLGGALIASVAGSAFATTLSGDGVFQHGVASGDPLTNAVVIWTRVSGHSRPVYVRWEVALDEAMTRVVRSGQMFTNADRDYTAKADVTGLRPGTTYYYRFHATGGKTVVGRTKTLPTGNVTQAKFAIFTCSDWEDGYFNAYDHALQYDDLDAVIHNGDYLYEYGSQKGVTPKQYGRAAGGLDSPGIDLGYYPQPRIGTLTGTMDLVALADYRARHALYKTDPSLQELHRKNPWITIWDDHESANNSWTGGAENHHADEGAWKAREAAAIEAYFEWMPIRDTRNTADASQNPTGMYRSYDYGSLMRLIMLDTRLAGRDLQLDSLPLIQTYAGARLDTLDGTSSTRQRDILGTAQRAWLGNTLAGSTQTWQIFGNQILNFYQNTPDVTNSQVLSATEKAQLTAILSAGFGSQLVQQLLALAPQGIPNPVAADSWTGYPSARNYFYGALLGLAKNPVLFTGDSHNAWAANLVAPIPGVGKTPVGVEFGGTSVTSGGSEQTLLGFASDKYAALLVESSQNRAPLDRLIWTDQSHRGYMLATITPSSTRCDQILLSTVFSRTYTASATTFYVAAGDRAISQA